MFPLRASEGPWALPESGSNSQGLVVFSQVREKARSQGSREWALSVALRDSPSLWLNAIFLFPRPPLGARHQQTSLTVELPLQSHFLISMDVHLCVHV